MSSTLIDRVTGGIVQTVTHPLEVASYGVGFVRGLAAATIRAAAGGGGPAHAEWIAPSEPLTKEALAEEALADDGFDEVPVSPLQQAFPLAATQRAPAEPGESYATEPSAVTRDSAHGGHGDDAEIDDWYDEKFLSDADEPTGVVEALEFGDQVVGLSAEPADEKAILSDAETLRHAAELPGERA